MIGYTTIGANDLDKALAFYDPLMEVVGGRRAMEIDNGQLYGFSQGAFFGVVTPFDKKAATAGNGTMIALSVGSNDKVDAAHAKAIELGAADEGEPGLRTDNFYGAYFRDPDGNKICVFHMG